MTKTRLIDIRMWLLVLEAMAALAALLLIVWWTMFAGRRRGERKAGERKPKR